MNSVEIIKTEPAHPCESENRRASLRATFFCDPSIVSTTERASSLCARGSVIAFLYRATLSVPATLTCSTKHIDLRSTRAGKVMSILQSTNKRALRKAMITTLRELPQSDIQLQCDFLIPYNLLLTSNILYCVKRRPSRKKSYRYPRSGNARQSAVISVCQQLRFRRLL